jgi:hypothetical protein
VTRGLVLLDKPSPRSFGMTAIAIEEEGQVRVLGLAPTSAQRGTGLTEDQAQDLVRAGHALSIKDVALPDKLSSKTVALWLGDAFLERAKALSLPPAPLPASAFEVEGGKFFLGPPELMYPYLDLWTVTAFRRFRSEHAPSARSETASLMRWVLPNRGESLAATWSASPNPDRELQVQLRTFARGSTERTLRAAHEKNLSGPPDELADLRLVVFTGGTGILREDVANRFAKAFALEVAAFRRPIEQRVTVEKEHVPAEKLKWLQMEEGQAEVDTSPLGLAIAALRSARPRQKILVVDSVRHHKIRETLQWLQPKILYVVAVTADRDLQIRRVRMRNLDPDLLFQHGTEREIPALSTEANRRVRESVPDSELREIFEAVQG